MTHYFLHSGYSMMQWKDSRSLVGGQEVHKDEGGNTKFESRFPRRSGTLGSLLWPRTPLRETASNKMVVMSFVDGADRDLTSFYK